MTQLIDLMGDDLTGHRNTTNVGDSLRRIMSELHHTARTKAGAARMLGVSPTTFSRWWNFAFQTERGIRQQPKTGKKAMVAAIRRGSLTPAREKRIRGKQERLKIHGLIVKSRDTRDRILHVGDHIPALKMGNVLSAWLAGDDDRADRLLNKHISQHYAEDLEFDELVRVWFE